MKREFTEISLHYLYEGKDASDILALGFATFYLNRCNHSGILEARPVGGLGQEGKYSIGSRYNKATSIKKIENIARFAKQIEVFNQDGAEFMSMLKKKHRNRRFLIYLDPPYYQKGPGLYLNHFQNQDHEALRDDILNCPFPWVLSYDRNDVILDLYSQSDCKVCRTQIRHTISGNTSSEELIISKLNLPDYVNEMQLEPGV